MSNFLNLNGVVDAITNKEIGTLNVEPKVKVKSKVKSKSKFNITDRQSFKSLYVITDEGELEELKNVSTIKFIKTLTNSLNKSRETIELMDMLTTGILDELKETLDNGDVDRVEIANGISEILSMQAEIFKVAKNSKDYIETLNKIERSTLETEMNVRLLQGNSPKGFREDKGNVIDYGKPDVIEIHK